MSIIVIYYNILISLANLLLDGWDSNLIVSYAFYNPSVSDLLLLSQARYPCSNMPTCGTHFGSNGVE